MSHDRSGYELARPAHVDISSLAPSKFRIVSVGDDYLVCNPYDAAGNPTTAVVYVMRPYSIRRTPFDGLTVGGVSYAYSSNVRRVATAAVIETQYITPDLNDGDVIYAVRLKESFPLTIGGTTNWHDLNVDAREWAHLPNSSPGLADIGEIATTTYGDATHVPQITVDANGFVTGAANVEITGLLSDSGVTPGSYTAANITVNAKGLVTAASNGSAGATVTGSDGQIGVISSGNVVGDANLTWDEANLVFLAGDLLGASNGYSFRVDNATQTLGFYAGTGSFLEFLASSVTLGADFLPVVNVQCSAGVISFGDPNGSDSTFVFAVDAPHSKTTSNGKHETSGDITIADSAKGYCQLDTSDSHYYRFKTTAGVVGTDDIGTVPP